MTFKIRPIDLPTFKSIWTPRVIEQLDQLIYSTDNWIDELESMNWAIDDQRNIAFKRVSMSNRLDGAQCYALVMDGEFALIREVEYCTYSIAAMSKGLESRLEEVKYLAADALRTGGRTVDSKYGIDGDGEIEYWKVPYTDFVPYVAPSSKDD